MADGNNNDQGNEKQRTDSCLPLLFVNGYPKALDHMTRNNLELFIPFLVRCSRSGSQDCGETEPPWWPKSVQFKVPLEKPKTFKQKDWVKELRDLITKCYEYHKQPFLLRYSSDLSDYDASNLRYVTASKNTISLYSKNPKKLLLTFRNENMLYDKKKRMTLWKKDENPSPEPEEPETFDIILCDYCDAEFYSEEAFSTHEKKCGQVKVEQLPVVDNIVISDEDDENEVEEISGNGQTDFMAYFFLKSATSDEIPKRNCSFLERTSLSPKKKKRPNQRTRHVMNKKEKDLEQLIPFSSPAGIVLTKKATVTEAYIEDCLKEIEEVCQAKPNTRIPARYRHRLQISPGVKESAVIKDMRKPRHYYWPKRTLRSLTKEVNFQFLNRSLIEKTQNCNVSLQKLTDNDIRWYQDQFKNLREEKERAEAAETVDLVSESEDEVEVEFVEAYYPETSTVYEEGLLTTPRLQESVYGIMPSLPQFEFAPSTLPFNSDVYSPYQNESSPSTPLYQQFTFSSTTTTCLSSGKRKRENHDPEKRLEKRLIQNWIQNVNGENFIIKQGTFINTN